MFAHQRHCNTLRCNSFSSLQRWNRAHRDTLECCQGNLCGTTMWWQARLHAILQWVASTHHIFEWLHQSIFFCHGIHGSVVASALQYLCGGTFSVCSWCSSLHDDATLTALQCVALRCSTSSSRSWALAWRSHLLASLALLLFLPAHVAAQTAITDTNLNTAVIAWVTNPTTATTTYGSIADWNTAAVTSMANLLYPTVAPATTGTARPTFNGDISKWNVASVSNMCWVRLDSV
jgi:hypothetical protein